MVRRTYNSPKRQRQGAETRAAIKAAAQALFADRGYEAATIADIARAAGVAAPTVYAQFASKRGILAEALKDVRFGQGYRQAIGDALNSADPDARLRLIATIARQVYEVEDATLSLWRAAGALAPELAAIEAEDEEGRRDAQSSTIDLLIATGRLNSGLGRETARDVLWTLTSRDLYRQLVKARAWSAAQYEAWLADLLQVALLARSP